MKKLSELKISPAPWDGVTFCPPGMNGYVVSNANLPEGDTRRKIVASDVLTRNARLIAASPKMYSAGYDLLTYLEEWMRLYPPSEWSTMGQAFQLLEEAQDELRAALAEAAGEEVNYD